MCLATIFLLYLGGSNSWAYDYDYNFNYAYNYNHNYDYDYNFPLPYIYGSYIYGSDPNVMIATTGSDGIVPTILEYSVEKIIVWFFSYPYPMEPDATKNAFHFYEDGNNDITGNGELDLDNTGDYPTLTFTPSSSLQEGVDYKVRIDYTAQDLVDRKIDIDRDGVDGEWNDDNWEMMFKFEIDEGSPPVIGWSQIYDPDNIFSENIVSAMVVDNQDGLWVGSKEGDICYFDGNDWNCEKPFESLIYSIDDIPCMVVDNEGVLWVGLNILQEEGGRICKLAKLVNNTWEIIDLDDILSNEFLNDMAVDSQNNIWIVASVGIFKYHDAQLEYFTSSGMGGPLSPLLISLVIDPDDNLWIRTADSEIWKLDVEAGVWVDEYTYYSDYQMSVINDMAADLSGNIWLGMDNGNLLKLKPGVEEPIWLVYPDANDLPGDCGDNSSIDPNTGYFLIGTSVGEPIWFEYTSANGLPWDCINTLRIDPNNAFIWVGTSSGLGEFDISYIDTDGDGTPDCNDLCPDDPLKTEPGVCDCGTPDDDSDGDGTPNCNDLCPADPLKTEPGVCDCGTPDDDSDGDGTPDCNDGCPNDINKTVPGECGCGVSDVDTDGDGVLDCNDGCPDDPGKIEPGICGCGESEKNPPYITNKSCSLKELIFNIKDDCEGVDPNSVVVVVEGGVDSLLISGVPHINGTSDNYKIKFLPEQNFLENTMITVYVRASDLVGNELEVDFQIQAKSTSKSTSGGKSQYYPNYPNYWLSPYNKMYQYNYMGMYGSGMDGSGMYSSGMYGGAQILSNYQTPGNFQQYSPLQPYNIYPTSVNRQNQVAMRQWPSRNFSFSFDPFCNDLLKTWYQKLLLTWPHQFNRQAYMFTNSQLQPYTYKSPNSLLQPFYQPQYQSWNSIGRQGQSFENYQVKSYEGIAIQSKQSLPTISLKQQSQGQVSQLNQQSYKPAITQSTTLHQPQYQTWNLKESQQQQTLNLQKQQQLINVQQQKSWTQTFQPYYR